MFFLIEIEEMHIKIFFFLIFLFLLLFKYCCLHFPITMFPASHSPPPPTLNLPPFGFVHVSFLPVP